MNVTDKMWVCVTKHVLSLYSYFQVHGYCIIDVTYVVKVEKCVRFFFIPIFQLEMGGDQKKDQIALTEIEKEAAAAVPLHCSVAAGPGAPPSHPPVALPPP